MRLCLRCGHLSRRAQDGSPPQHCQGCGRPFSRMCERQHSNPGGARYCSACGSECLSGERAPYIALGWLPRLFAIASVIAATRYGTHHLPLILCTALRITIDGIALILDIPTRTVYAGISRLIGWTVAVAIASLLLPGGRQARQMAWRGLQGAARLLGRAMVMWKGVGGRPKPMKKEKWQ